MTTASVVPKGSRLTDDTNKRAVRLIIHPGLGKCATTLLQNEIFPMLNATNLGKSKLESHERTQIHRALFPPVDSFRQVKLRFRNPKLQFQRYADMLSKTIQGAKAKSDSEIFVLSDETMISYGSADMNLLRILTLVEHAKHSLEELGFDVTVDLVVTIRSQLSFLPSWYAFNYPRLRKQYPTFSDLIRRLIEDPYQGVPGLLFYDDLYSMVVTHLHEHVKVRFVPFEILESEGAVRYGQRVLGISEGSSVTTWSGGVVNGNQSHRLRVERAVPKLLAHLANGASLLVRKNIPMANVLESVLRSKAVASALRSNQRYKPGKQVRLDASQSELVRQIFHDSNERFAAMSGVDLSPFNYP